MQSIKTNFKWLRFLVVIVLIFGILFRFVNLGKKVYWIEETATSVRISGYSWAEMDKALGTYTRVPEIGIEDLQKYQRPNPQKSFMDTIKGLASEEPQLPPLYFLLVRLWVQWFGNTVAVIRSMSALISLLAFPCMYWLCLELFESSLVGWIAIALLAVSPFHLIFAQEARPYSIWTVATLLSSAVLLRAMRLKTKGSWGMYAATIPLGLYSHAFFGLVAIAHGIYVVALEGFRITKTVIAYLIASIIGFIFFLPWVLTIINNFSQVAFTTSWGQKKSWALWGLGSQLTLLAKWARNISAAFLDADQDQKVISLGFENGLAYLIQLSVVLILLSLVVYSIYFIYRNAPRRVWLFILPLMGVTALFLTLPDLISGTTRSTVPRYSVPCYIGIQLAVAYLLASKIAPVSTQIWQQKLWRLILVALISCGVLSGIVISQAESWWTKYGSYYDLQMARIVNQAPKPLLICGGFEATQSALPMIYVLEPKVRLQLVIEPNQPKISKGFSDVFLFKPSEEVLDKFKKEQPYKLKPVYEYTKSWLGRRESGILLWRVEQ
jgi:uncharacterized membrane protein